MSARLIRLLTPEEVERRARLEAAMATRAARWCAQQVEACRAADEQAGRQHVPGIVAQDLANITAQDILRAIYERGVAATTRFLVQDAREVAALNAWGSLVYLVGPGRDGLVDVVYERHIAALEAADAAGTWVLRGES